MGSDDRDAQRAAAAGKPSTPCNGTVQSCPLAVITVILDQPAESDDTFEVVSDDGSYKRNLGAGKAAPLAAGAKVLRFEGIDPKKSYKLLHKRKGSKRPIFLGRPVPLDITKGTKSQTAPDAYAQILSQVPKKLPDRYVTDRPVDPDLAQESPVLVNLQVKDPEL